MDINHNGKKVAELEDFALWKPLTEVPGDGDFVLLTLDEEGDRWVEPGCYVNGRFLDIHRAPFRETIVAWVKFPDAFDR